MVKVATTKSNTKQRPRIKAEDRQKVYNKYGGRCAYCGCKLKYKEMQIDHVVAVKRGGENKLDNYNPACRMCNFYKATHTVEKFRERLELITRRLFKELSYRLALKYGLINEGENKIEFYFEKIQKATNDSPE